MYGTSYAESTIPVYKLKKTIQNASKQENIKILQQKVSLLTAQLNWYQAAISNKIYSGREIIVALKYVSEFKANINECLNKIEELER
jgi:hypothetical protein